MEQKNEFERLPKSVIPSHYNLTLEPDLVACVFSGSEQIDVEVKCSTSTIKMNAVCINVKSTSWKSATQEFSDVTVTYDIDDETVSFIFPEELQEGKGTLSIAFTGELNDLMKGFYRSKYKTPSGEERICATTQFEATDARRAFPCWDEPAIKASFDITLIVPKDRVALSNMPVKKESDVDGKPDKHRVEFDRSPIMSTYLLAFIVGEYDYVEDTDSDGVRVRVYTPQGKKEQGRFALEVATKTLPFYHKYFNVPYPLPKVDLIAIADFAAGAMENWGLVTYRETAVLVDEENSSAANKQRVALVVGHELAHQWFGNLVTMEWWTHLWLNEGFASFIEYLCVDNLFPDYDIWTQFAVQDYCVALKIDALQNSHPIEVPVGNPDEIDEIFDTISYCKGASVIRMLHNFLGDKDFRAGMKVYLDRHKYTNTFTEDLWAALGETSGKPVAKIMNTWTKQMGFPVLEVDEVEEGNKRTLTITQTKFCADGNTDDTSLWMVPVNICSASSSAEPIHSFVLEDKSTTVTLDNVKPGEWIKLNVGGVGFYRTRYSTSMLDRLVAAVKDKSMPPRDRLSLQNDLFAMARAGITSMVDALKVAEAFINEDNYTVWSNLTSNLGALSVILQYTDYYDQLKAFLRQLFSRTAKEVGWDAKPGEGHLKALLRSLMINRMGLCDDAETIAEAKKRFTAHADGSKQLPADLRAPVYSIVLSSGGEETYNQVLEIFRKTDLNEEKVRILRSLGAAKDAKLIARTLKFALDDEVRSQDKIYAVIGTTGSVEGREQAWKFVQEHWKELNALYTGGFLFARIIQYTTEDFVTQEKYDEIEAFFKEHPAPAAERTIKQSLENITLSRSLLERDCDAMRDFLCQ